MKARAPKISETQEQLVIVAYINQHEFVDDVIWTHIRAERSNAVDGRRAKKMGVKPSLPDLMFIPPKPLTRGWIEMKERGWRARREKSGKYTEHEQKQLAMHARLRDRGDWVVICETLDEVKAVFNLAGMPLRPESRTTERIRRGFATAINEVRK